MFKSLPSPRILGHVPVLEFREGPKKLFRSGILPPAVLDEIKRKRKGIPTSRLVNRVGERNPKPGGRSEDITSLPVKINPLSPLLRKGGGEKKRKPQTVTVS